MMDVLSLGGSAWLAVALLMLVLWVVHLAIRNAAIVDVGWTFGIPLAAAVYAWRVEGGGPRVLRAGPVSAAALERALRPEGR